MRTALKASYEQLWENLIDNLTLDLFEEEEIEAVAHDIRQLDAIYRQKTLALCVSLSHSASGLVPNVLRRIKTAAKILAPGEMERWVTHAFDLYESKGMDAFFQFLSKTEENDLDKFRTLDGLYLHRVISLLETCLRGMSGMDIKIAPDNELYTDTGTVFLPPVIGVYDEVDKNFLLYKLMAVHQWAQISLGTLTPAADALQFLLRCSDARAAVLQEFFLTLQERETAIDLYNMLDAFRRDDFLRHEVPGLMNAAGEIRLNIYHKRPLIDDMPEKPAFMEGLYQFYLSGEMGGFWRERFSPLIPLVESMIQEKSDFDRLRLFSSIYDRVSRMRGAYHGTHLLYLGTIKPDKVSLFLKSMRDARKNRLENIISKIIHMPDVEIKPFLRNKVGDQSGVEDRPQKETEYFQVRGRLFELDRESKELIQESGIFSDGIIFDGSSAIDTRAVISLEDFMAEEEDPKVEGGIQYDEWDFRRSDYKKGWCHLFEQDIPPGEEPVVELTLRRYGGYVKTLRRKFELLKRELKLLRRQREGDDVDIDAVVEAFADMRAGLSPSQDLFVKLDRRARNIAALFLLDMSGSTKGWVNRAEKEALVLMCEALEALGDRYAVYGFSGVTRNKCEFYRIKNFSEPYSQPVKTRIAGIIPKDYTRMGPPIRHASHILNEIDARTKLLITLSDGHPEDRDGYRGDYGIEDTRRALIEAKERGIQPFCITIDKEASSYLPHMFGEVSYVVLDDVRRLPNKITEIYRKLTT